MCPEALEAKGMAGANATTMSDSTLDSITEASRRTASRDPRLLSALPVVVVLASIMKLNGLPLIVVVLAPAKPSTFGAAEHMTSRVGM